MLALFLRPAQGLKVDLYEIFQFAHEGDTPRRLRKELESLVAAVKDEDLGPPLPGPGGADALKKTQQRERRKKGDSSPLPLRNQTHD